MDITLIAVGTKMPSWVSQGYQEYAKRMPPDCRLKLHEVAASQRSKSTDPLRAIREEGERMLKAIPKGNVVVTLDVPGKMHSTESLAAELQSWLASGRDVAIMVGGADGLAPEVRQRADRSWSLSRLTFPHPMVRVILAEQIYRAHSYSNNHPYHRSS